MQYVLSTALQLGCIYSLVALGLFLSYRVLNIADLTTDGCFVLGMAVSVTCAATGHPVVALPLALVSGGLAGLCTALLQTRFHVPSILAGIVTNTGLYTVNLAVMGFSSNVSLLKQKTVYSLARSVVDLQYSSIVLSAIVACVCMILVRFFLDTKLGLSLRATGDNPDMVKASSIDPQFTTIVGLVLANCCTALSGALAGQLQKSCDINAGTGIVVIGLASLIIGETVLSAKGSLTKGILACLVGNILYRLLYALILQTNFIPVECLKLVTALIVAVAIAAPAMKQERLEMSGGKRRC